MSEMLKAYDAVMLRVNMDNLPIDQMSDEEFVSHRAQALVGKGKLDAPFVINPVQWLDKVAQVKALLSDSENLRTRALEADKRAATAEAEMNRVLDAMDVLDKNLKEAEARANLYWTANGLAENAMAELARKLSTVEGHAAHYKKLLEARSLPSAPVEGKD